METLKVVGEELLLELIKQNKQYNLKKILDFLRERTNPEKIEKARVLFLETEITKYYQNLIDKKLNFYFKPQNLFNPQVLNLINTPVRRQNEDFKEVKCPICENRLDPADAMHAPAIMPLTVPIIAYKDNSEYSIVFGGVYAFDAEVVCAQCFNLFLFSENLFTGEENEAKLLKLSSEGLLRKANIADFLYTAVLINLITPSLLQTDIILE